MPSFYTPLLGYKYYMSLTAASSNYSNFPFTPLEIPGCVVWFDANDSQTYSGSGTASFQWRSKGIYSLTATSNAGPAPTAATCNGYPSIYFPANSPKTASRRFPCLEMGSPFLAA